MSTRAAPASCLDTSDGEGLQLVRSLRIGQQCVVRCPSGQRLCRAALYMESKDKQWMALPAVLSQEDGAEEMMPDSYASCHDTQTEIGPCRHQAAKNGGNLSLIELDGNLPKEAIRNYVSCDGFGHRVPRVFMRSRKDRSLLKKVKTFLVHTHDCQAVRITVRDDAQAFVHTDKDRHIEKWVALPINDTCLTHQDCGALVTTHPRDVGPFILALGIFGCILEVRNKGVCCLVAPLWSAIEAINRQLFPEELKVMMPIMQDGNAGPETNPVDMSLVLESLKDLFAEDGESDSAYGTRHNSNE